MSSELSVDKPASKSRSRKATPEPVSPLDPVWTYEEAVAEIETIVEQMEAGDLDLAAVFARFEAATGQLKRCKTFLQDKQEQVDLLLETLVDDVDF